MPATGDRFYRLDQLGIESKSIIAQGILDSPDPANLLLTDHQTTVFQFKYVDVVATALFAEVARCFGGIQQAAH